MNIKSRFREKIFLHINKKQELVFNLNNNLGRITSVISTQAPSVDRALACDIYGNWGVPCGKITFMASDPDIGKTTLSLHICSEAQKLGGLAIYIDCEHRFDAKYAENIGVNTEELIYGYPTTLDEGIDIIAENIKIIKTNILTLQNKIDQCIKAKKPDRAEKYKAELSELKNMPIAVILDSTSIATKQEREGSNEKGGHARLLSQKLRSIVPDIDELNIALVIICQRKNKINIGWGGGYGPQEAWLAEKAIKFHSTCGIKLINKQTLKAGSGDDNKVGKIVLAQNIRNSVNMPYITGEFEIYYGKGIDYYISLHNTLCKYYGAVKNKRTFKLKNPDIEWTDKGGLRKILTANAELQERIDELLKSPARIKIKEEIIPIEESELEDE